MRGWKTYTAAALTAGLGVLAIINGDTATGLQQLTAALAIAGIGHKIEKTTKP